MAIDIKSPQFPESIFEGTLSNWLKKANSFRRNGTKNDGGIDNLLQSFGIDGLDKENHFNPNEDDISDWFGGAPGWLRRS